jgi:hypothetical protein
MTSDYDSSDSPSSSELGDQHHQHHHHDLQQQLLYQRQVDQAGPSRCLSEEQLSHIDHRQNSMQDSEGGMSSTPQPVFELGLEVVRWRYFYC